MRFNPLWLVLLVPPLLMAEADPFEKAFKGEPACGPPKQIYISAEVNYPDTMEEMTGWVESYQIECQSRQACLMALYVMSNGKVIAHCGAPDQEFWSDGFVRWMTWYQEV